MMLDWYKQAVRNVWQVQFVLYCRYLLDKRWFDQWKEYVHTGDQNSSSYPGKIDNTELFEGKFCYSEIKPWNINISLNDSSVHIIISNK